MISVQEALQYVEENSHTGKIITLKLTDAKLCFLAEDVISKINMPPFRQSAMDGYALNHNNTNTFTVTDEVKAGDSHNPILKKGDAVRIFTGAAVPDTANAVIMQEKTECNNTILTTTGTILENANIRPLGEQIKKGGVALQKGTKLNAAAIGFLASLGVTHVSIYKKPSIAIITTGNELILPGEELEYGKIYESNSIMLESALYSMHYTNTSTFKINDNYIETVNALREVIHQHDVVLITGGISVGDYDFVGKALQEIDVREIFYKVKQKPGKPLFYGKKGETTIFALPGNPAAALSCFYIYVQTALNKIAGSKQNSIEFSTAKSNSSFKKKGDRAQFLKAQLLGNYVTILEGQSSAMQHTFALANALVYIPEDINEIKKDTIVQLLILPT